MKQLKAVIFDVDGTLAETESDGHRVAFNRAFKHAGLDWYWDTTLYTELLRVSGGKERIVHYLQHYQPNIDKMGMDDAFIKRLHAAKNAIYTELLATGQLPLRTGVSRLIRQIRAAGLQLAIATTSTNENVSALIDSSFDSDLRRCFSCISAGDVVRHKKPAADIYQHVLAGLGVDAAECVAIEDSENGLRAALSAQIATLVTVNSYTENDNFEGAVTVLDHLGEPDKPCRTLAGKTVKQMVTVEVLKDIHAQFNYPAGK